MTIQKAKEAFIHGFGYPVYAVDAVGRAALVVAGGGGAVKTGVPNRIDVVEIERCSLEHPPSARITAGLDTGTEAVMSLAVTNLGGCASFVTSLEGHSCVEYFVTRQITQTQTHHNLSRSVINNHNVTTNAAGFQSTDTQHERTVRKRKGSLRDSNDVPSSTTSDTPTGEIGQDQSDINQWSLTKLRQFTLPSIIPNRSNEATTTATTGTRRTRTASSSATGLPTCVTTGGPAGCWFAVGSDLGSVFLFDRVELGEPSVDIKTRPGDSMKPFLIYPDVSAGLSAGVCALALSATPAITPDSQSESSAHDRQPPLLATICEQPSWSAVHVWSVRNCTGATLSCPLPTSRENNRTSSSHPRQRKTKAEKAKKVPSTKSEEHFFASASADLGTNGGNADTIGQRPYAVAYCSRFSTGGTPPPSPVDPNRPHESSPERSSYRFKHCQFLKCHVVSSSSSVDQTVATSTSSDKSHTSASLVEFSSLLVTTMQPLCANRKSVSRVIVWLVPAPSRSSLTEDGQHGSPMQSVPSLQLAPLTDIALPQGDLPACLAVHPSRSRGLIGVGTMDGRVEVYFLSPRTHTLTCVYSLKDAHPIFVTSLTFLPVQSPQASLQIQSSSSNKFDKSKPIASPETSYDLVSVSVDRMLRWHAGPSCTRISHLAHGVPVDPVGAWNRGKRVMITMLTYLGLVFFIPILLSLLDTMCYVRL